MTARGGSTYYYRVAAVYGVTPSPRSRETSAYSHVPGDINDDRTVDFADLLILARTMATPTARAGATVISTAMERSRSMICSSSRGIMARPLSQPPVI